MDIIHNITNNYPGLSHEDRENLKKVLEIVNITKHQNLKIMGQLEDLKAESAGLKQDVADLQSTVDTEQAQIAALLDTNATVVTGLNQRIVELEAQIAAGVDPAALQATIDELKATRDSIATTKADIAGTIPDAPPA